MAEKRHFLFLQGNATPFYRRLGKCLAEAGHQVSRINVGGGDYLFWGDWNAINWRQTPDELAAEMPDLMRRLGPSDIILFGDCRPIHRVAIESAKTSGIRVNVFEEGYFRPHWITLERDGVNGYSKLPRDPQWYLETARHLPPLKPVQAVGGGLRNRILYDIAWQAANYGFWLKFPNFRTHRPYPIWKEYASWLRRLARLPQLTREAERLQRTLLENRERYFLFPLQLDTDTQIRVHSRWQRLTPIIEHVITSFSNHAPPNSMLVIKNHPLDNGLINYRRQIQRLAERHRLLGRVHFIDGGDLNLLAKHAAGIVTVNSTAAMSGILEKVPTIVLGKAIFDLPGLTFQHGLDRFWEEHTSQVVSRDLLEAFRRVVLEQCQINGNFYTAIGQQTALQMCVRRLC